MTIYPDRGHSAIAPWRLTIILIMQFLENLSDRQTAVKELTRLEHLEETLKYALNTLAAFAPTWLEEVLTPEFYDRYGQKV